MSTSTSRLLLQNSSILTSTSSYRNENRPVAWYHFSLSFDSSKVLISIVCYSSSQHDDMQLRRDLLHDGSSQPFFCYHVETTTRVHMGEAVISLDLA